MDVPPTRKVITILFAAMLLIYPFGKCLAASKYKEGSLPPLALDQNLGEAFISLHELIRTRVETNKLPHQRAMQADQLKLELEKALIRIEAQLKILRIDTAASKPDQLDKLMDQIIQIAQQRERLKIIYLLRMHLLADVSSADTVFRFKPEPQQQPAQTSLTQSVQSNPEINIRFVPEDVTSGERE